MEDSGDNRDGAGRDGTKGDGSDPLGDSPPNPSSSRDRIAESIYEHLVTSVCIDFASNMHRILKTGKDNIPLTTTTSLAATASAPENLQESLTAGVNASLRPSVNNSFECIVAHTRQQLYPELYKEKNEGEVMETLHKYAVDLPDGTSQTRKRRWDAGAAADSDGENDDDNDDGNGDPKPHNKKKRKIGDADDDGDDEDYRLEEDKDDDEMEGQPGPKRSSPPATFAAEIAPSSDAAPSSSGETTRTGPGGIRVLDIWGNHPPKEPVGVTCRCGTCNRRISVSRFASHLDKCMGLSTRPLAGSATRG